MKNAENDYFDQRLGCAATNSVVITKLWGGPFFIVVLSEGLFYPPSMVYISTQFRQLNIILSFTSSNHKDFIINWF